MKITKIAALIALASVGAISTGCTVVDTAYDVAKDDMGNVKDSIASSRRVIPSSVQEIDGIWLGGEAFKVSEIANAPSVLRRDVSFRQVDPISVSELVTMLGIDLGMRIVLTQDAIDYTSGNSSSDNDGANPADGPGSQAAEANIFDNISQGGVPASDIRFTLDYKGSVTGLLDVISSKAGLFWRYEKGQVVIMRNETKTYMIDILNGKTEFTSNMISDLAGASEDGGTSNSVHETKTEIKPESAWKSIEKSVQTMLSKSGQLAFAESVGTLTVTDTPEIQNKIASYIKSINSVAGKQISVKTDVFEITSDENGKFDTDILALFDWKGDLNIGLDGNKLSFGVGSNDSSADNKFSKSSNATLNLLRTNKNASLVTSSTLYAMNGQPTPVQQMDEIGYLKEISVTTAEGGTPSTSFTPGKTSQGFSMMLLPRIMSDGRVSLNFAVDSSRINSIDEYGSEDSGKIQLPNRSTNKYQQMVAVKSGHPLMIAGVERTENSANIGSKFGRKSWFLGGSQAGGKRKMMTMIVLTPYIMQK